jgi:succinyl-diaminopimelate desuccinylase
MSVDRELADTVADLVSLPTENPPGDERRASEYVVEWFGERGVDAELVADPYEDRPQAVASVGDGDPTVVLNGHLDVVPAGDRAEWSHGPYDADVEDGRLYGCGSADMKAGVAVGMSALATLADGLRTGDLEGTLLLQAVVGEETADPGTKRLLELGYDGDYGVVLEPTECRVATSEKGLAWYEFTVRGEPSHASRPDEGVNAVARARPLLDALADYDARIREREDDLVGRAYATVTGFDAGTKENVVPESAVVTVDRRMLPEESVEEVDREVASLAEAVAAESGVDVGWERTRTYESAAVPVDCRLAETLRDHAAAVAGAPTDPWGIEASTDVRNLVNDAGMEAVTWGPGSLEQAHGYDEYVDLADVTAGRDALVAALRDLLSE